MIAPFQQAHFDAVREELIPAHRAIADQCRPIMGQLAAQGLATTLTAPGGEVLAVLGAGDVGGECEVFMFPSTEAMKRYPLTFWRELKWELRRMKLRFGRLCAIGSDTETSRRFLQRLGFRLVGRDGRPGRDECELLWRLG
jgi:hypothetical protein